MEETRQKKDGAAGEEGVISADTPAANSATDTKSQDSAKASKAINATQLRERSRKKRHVVKKLEKKLEILHRHIKK